MHRHPVAQLVAVIAQPVAQALGHVVRQPLGGEHAAGPLDAVAQLTIVEAAGCAPVGQDAPRLALRRRWLVESAAGNGAAIGLLQAVSQFVAVLVDLALDLAALALASP